MAAAAAGFTGKAAGTAADLKDAHKLFAGAMPKTEIGNNIKHQ